MMIQLLSLHNPEIRLSDLANAVVTRNSRKMFENALSSYLGCGSKILGSGRLAIKAALQAIGVKTKDEIIIPAFTCPSVGEAVIEAGAIPVFADVSKDDVNIDPNNIESLITDKTKVIIVAHIFGIPSQIDIIAEIAKKYNIYIIEDCCQSLGSKYKDKLTGTWGDFGVFSFGISKNISTIYGGAICYKEQYGPTMQRTKFACRDVKASPFRYLSSFIVPIVNNKYFYGILGNAISHYSTSKNTKSFSSFEGEMTSIEAACAYQQLKRYENIRKARNDNAKLYKLYFKDYFKLIDTPLVAEPAYLYFPVITPHAKELKRKLRNHSIEVADRDEMYYSLYEYPMFNQYRRNILLNVEKFENEYLIFPVGHNSSETESICERTIKIIQEAKYLQL